MNEAVIKEIKSMYSSRKKLNHPTSTTPEIQTIRTCKRNRKTFFNGVIDKLNIIVNNQNK